ncbi:hypothetical protein [Hyalangium versicolor]|uniref:hypothetical protein n=1 Tax=Hyalangium versicolor TaxID=2861190 RepID=UPI001CCAC033|nr:hypothetical protein [Hyalangium versicolor]
MQLRKSYDVFPWIETYRKNWGAWTRPGDPQKDVIQHKQPRNLLVSELVHSNYLIGTGQGATADDIYFNGAFNIPWQGQLTREDGTAVSSDLLQSDQAFGTGEDEIKRFRTGMRIPPQEVRNLIVLGALPPSPWLPSNYLAYENNLAVAFRGYQLYPKASNPLPQYTYAEYAERGYVSEYKVEVIRLPLVSNTTNEMPTGVLQLQQDFACDYITLNLDFQRRTLPPPNSDVVFDGADPALMSFLDVKLESPGRPIMNDFCCAPLLGHTLARTAWLWDQPLSGLKGDEWKVRVKSRLPVTWTNFKSNYGATPQLVVALHGHTLTKP